MDTIITYITASLQNIYSIEELKSLTIIICRDLLELNMTDIYIGKDINLSANKKQILEQTVERLKKHEPIQYVKGRTDFYGISLKVTPDVLIPRPETEELVEWILKENAGQIHILDIGTGSGCIAIALSRNMAQAEVDAWDISEEALVIARHNNETQHTNVKFHLRDIFENPEYEKKYHIIVSNPPYVTEQEKAFMEKNVLAWEPETALFVPDSDPLRFYRRIAQMGTEMLMPGGKLYFEINQAYGAEVADMLQTLGYNKPRIIKDLFGKDRFVTALHEDIN